ncbi:hypothetical protein BLA29_003328 [Euroglyphus maynei]|uniref:Uncharacterized protein n=1 Tax=Euroglyphus maynei TaxID=6958 RepID=A0A1Y3BPL0_EURMA|nr:hypothetical protein BLA29_003328 [Euroglyphus maynei]
MSNKTTATGCKYIAIGIQIFIIIISLLILISIYIYSNHNNNPDDDDIIGFRNHHSTTTTNNLINNYQSFNIDNNQSIKLYWPNDNYDDDGNIIIINWKSNAKILSSLIVTCFLAYILAIIVSVAIGIEHQILLLILTIIFAIIFICSLITLMFSILTTVIEDGHNFSDDLLNFWNSLFILIVLFSGLEFYTITYLICFIYLERKTEQSYEYSLAKMINDL